MPSPPGDTGRLFIVEQRGSGGVSTRADIKIMNLGTNAINATPFLSISPVSTSSEQGLLGLAFDPNYASNGFFYVDYTNSAGTSVNVTISAAASASITASAIGWNSLPSTPPRLSTGT